MTASIERAYKPDLVLPPGETLAEVLEQRGMTQTELARRTGLSIKHINQIVNGSAPISPETALVLERATSVPARVWNNLEVNYREFLSRQDEDARLEAEVDWLQELPVKELVKRGFIRQTARPVDQLREICTFFGVANRKTWIAVWHKPTAYRTSAAFTSHPGAVAAWLRIGELEATDLDCQPFNKAGLAQALDGLRALTQQTDPKIWWPELRSRCAAVGVAVVAHPEIKGARINGAARWLAPDKAIVQVSLRHRWSDIFWFTLFHELAHLLIHSKKDAFINDVTGHSGVEQEADAFASQLLIRRRHEPELAGLTTSTEVVQFANRIKILPGIVVGRLQHDGRWPYSKGNELKQRLTFVTRDD
jgi:HTH-type transcriptional regulator/antitoxin HigA